MAVAESGEGDDQRLKKDMKILLNAKSQTEEVCALNSSNRS